MRLNGNGAFSPVETYISPRSFGVIRYLHPLAIALRTLQHVYVNSILQPFLMMCDAFPSLQIRAGFFSSFPNSLGG